MQAAKRFTATISGTSLIIGLTAVITMLPAPHPAAAATGLNIDKQVATHQAAAATSISSPALSTAQPAELLLAFITSDGGTGTKQSIASVTGGSLSWRLRQRANLQNGTSEIWQAVAPAVVTNLIVKATRGNGSYGGSIVVVALIGASTTVDGASSAAGASTGAPAATLSPTQAGSWIWAAGNDWDRATARTVGTGQAKADEYLATGGDTYWVQRQAAPSPGGGLVPVTINDTAPTADRWNLALIEIPPAAVDTVPPSTPTGVHAIAAGPNLVNLDWTASTDNIGVTGYQVLRNGSPLASTAGTSYADGAVAAGTSYNYSIVALDAAGNASPGSSPVSVSTPVPDTTPPVIGGPTITAIGQNSALVSWTTDEPASSQIAYGTSTSYGLTTPLDSALSSTHSQTLSGLTPSTGYHLQVLSADAAGNLASSADASFSTTAPAPDVTPPTISISAPAAGTTVTGTVTLAASASDNVGVVGVQFLLDGSNLGANLTAAPYTASWASGSVSNGQHTLSAVARDAAGNTGTAGAVTVTVNNDSTPPTASITSPAGGSNVNGTISVSATATDNVGVASVQFQLDGINLGALDSAAPYSVQWDTSTASNGGHVLTALARDAAGNTATSAGVNVAVNNAGASDPSVIGQWGPVLAWPAVSIHAALLPTGKILTFQGDFATGGQQYSYDPATGVITQVPDAAADLFCAGQAMLPDGRLMVIGGTATSGGLGITAVTAYNPSTERWEPMTPMHHPRWYATGTTLGDGKVLSTSGYNNGIGDLVTIPEVYNPPTASWTDLASSATENLPIYPFVYQLPDGRVLSAGASETATDTRVLNLQTQTWSVLDSRLIDGGSIANYAPGKFLKVGSAADSGNSGPSAKTAFTLDLNQPSPTWQPTSPMQYPRSFVNLTNLPDGTVLATGGESDKSGYVNANAILPAELWNPATGSWTTQAAMSVPRLYHSTAVLLPDGRVFISGSGGDSGVPDQKNSQIFSPAYLFKGPRPVISSVPGTVNYGASTFVQTPDAASISSVSLIRTGSVTHSFDQNARAISLPFTRTASGLNVTMPVNGNTAPPGYYLLSIVNGSGVPSASSFVRFAAPWEDASPPSAPSNLTATGGVGSASLNWTAATDNVGVTGYVVYRSSSPGFTPSPATRIGQTSSTSYADAGMATGNYYYRVTAVDAAGNGGPPSNEAAAAVTADTSPPTAPTGLTATLGSGQVSLAWTAATDNVAVTSYQISRNATVIGTSGSTSYLDNSVAPGSSYSYTVTALDAAGNLGPASNTVSVSTPSTVVVSLDAVASRHAIAATTITSAALSTTGNNEVVLAFFSADGPGGASQSVSISNGGGLTWRLRQRTNTRSGTAEIWQAIAPTPVSNLTIVGGYASGSYQGSITLAAFRNASTTVDGAVGSGQAATGAPTVSVTATKTGSQVWAVGNDWDAAIARTVGAGQAKVDEYLAPAGDTFWVQRLSAVTANAGPVTINDSAPTGDRWNLAAIEIPPSS